MAEKAFSVAQRSKLKEEADAGDRRAALALSIVESPSRMSTAMLIGDTISNTAAAAVSLLIINGDRPARGLVLCGWTLLTAVIILIACVAALGLAPWWISNMIGDSVLPIINHLAVVQ